MIVDCCHCVGFEILTLIRLSQMCGNWNRLQRTFKARGINSYVRPQNTLRQLLCKPKDKTDKEDICGPVYYIKCQGKSGDTCSQSYIGETERTFGVDLEE